MGLAGYSKRVLRQPDGLVRINEKHWLARDLVFAHSGLSAFIFNEPTAAQNNLAVGAGFGSGQPHLNDALWMKPVSSKYEMYLLPVDTLSLPLTLIAWIYGTAGATANAVLAVKRAYGSDGGVILQRSSSELAQALAMDTAAAASNATSSGTFVSNEWQHIAAVFISATSRRALLNGGNAGTNSTSRALPTDANYIGIAINGSTTTAGSLINTIAHPVVVNRALSDAEIAFFYKQQQEDPWCLFAERPIWVPVSSGGSSDTPVNPDVGNIAITGYAPTIAQSANQALTPGVGSVTISGYAPTVAQSANQSIPLEVGNLAITGYAPTVAQSAAQNVQPDVGSLAITGYAPTISQSSAQDIQPAVGTLTITGHVPTVAQTGGVSIVPQQGTLLFTGYPPTVAQTQNNQVAPAVGAMVITGYAPTVDQSAGNNARPDVGTIAITGHAPTVARTVNNNIDPPVGQLTITGYAPTVVRTTGGGGGLSASDIWTYEIESGKTAEELMRLMAAVLLGKTTVTVTGPNTAIVTFEAANGSKVRVTATMTGSERTSTSFDETF